MESRTMSLSPLVLDPIIETLVNLNASRYTCAAGLVVMLYDWLLMLPSEVEQIWKRRKGPISILYLMNRYIPTPFLLMANYHMAGLRPGVSILFCRVETIALLGSMGLALTISTWLLSLRVISLWNHNKPVVYSVYLFYSVMQIVTWTLISIAMHRIYPTIVYHSAFKICGADSFIVVGGVYFAPILFEVYIFSLHIIHHLQHARQNRKHQLPSFNLLDTLYHDGYIYFIVIVSLRVMTCAVWATAPHSLWYMSTLLEFGMMIALTSRFHLNLRKAGIPHDHSLTTDTRVTFDMSYESSDTPITFPRASRLRRFSRPQASSSSSTEKESRTDVDGSGLILDVILVIEKAENSENDVEEGNGFEMAAQGGGDVILDELLGSPDSEVMRGPSVCSLSIERDAEDQRCVWSHYFQRSVEIGS